MKFYDTLTRQKKEFVPLNSEQVMIYACGPTVYNYIHIGNARPLCVFDVLRRFLEYANYNVRFVQNFTDIDDKIINRAKNEHSDYSAVSEKYIREYDIDAQGLNIRPANVHPRASECIDEIIDMISELERKGYTYKTIDGDVYFRVRKFKDYGKLSKQSIDSLQGAGRVEIERAEAKEYLLDFVLWKACKPGEPKWESPWGDGRPGWHIECSAMVKKYLGRSIDIHCGGQDLIFPHHENEIAQSECCNDVFFTNFWMHNGYVNIDSKKMSKSQGNFFTVREIAHKYGYEPIRYMMISAHYRSPINYSDAAIQQCAASLERLHKFRRNFGFLYKAIPHGYYSDSVQSRNFAANLRTKTQGCYIKFMAAMEDDLNTADALAAVFEMVRECNVMLEGEHYNREEIGKTIDLFDTLTGILGILYNRETDSEDDEIAKSIELREKARRKKDWELSDKIRDELCEKGIVLEDTARGVRWRLK
jgi:cysteinyl-tRNA synthetase